MNKCTPDPAARERFRPTTAEVAGLAWRDVDGRRYFEDRNRWSRRESGQRQIQGRSRMTPAPRAHTHLCVCHCLDQPAGKTVAIESLHGSSTVKSPRASACGVRAIFFRLAGPGTVGGGHVGADLGLPDRWGIWLGVTKQAVTLWPYTDWWPPVLASPPLISCEIGQSGCLITEALQERVQRAPGETLPKLSPSRALRPQPSHRSSK